MKRLIILFVLISSTSQAKTLKLTPEMLYQKLIKIEALLERQGLERTMRVEEIKTFEACEARCEENYPWDREAKNYSGDERARLDCYKDCQRIRPVGVRDEC